MEGYYVNRNQQRSGDYEVHKGNCYWLSLVTDSLFLGYFTNCQDAVALASAFGYTPSNGCVHCCRACHTG